MSAALVSDNFSPISLEISFHMIKKKHLCGVQTLFMSLKTQKLRIHVSQCQPSSTSMSLAMMPVKFLNMCRVVACFV